jgi:hypothetical protein
MALPGMLLIGFASLFDSLLGRLTRRVSLMRRMRMVAGLKMLGLVSAATARRSHVFLQFLVLSGAAVGMSIASAGRSPRYSFTMSLLDPNGGWPLNARRSQRWSLCASLALATPCMRL